MYVYCIHKQSGHRSLRIFVHYFILFVIAHKFQNIIIYKIIL